MFLDTCEIQVSDAVKKFFIISAGLINPIKERKEINIKPNLKMHPPLIENKRRLTLIYIRSYH